jgi:tetratricopeptide (TPR) repeat protein
MSEAEKRAAAGAELQEQGRVQDAISEYAEAIHLDPLHAPAYINRGIAYAELGETQRAIQDFDAAISLNPDDARAYTGRGLAFSTLGQLQRAVQDFDAAIRLNPQDAGAYSLTLRAWQRRLSAAGRSAVGNGIAEPATPLETDRTLRSPPQYVRCCLDRPPIFP